MIKFLIVLFAIMTTALAGDDMRAYECISEQGVPFRLEITENRVELTKMKNFEYSEDDLVEVDFDYLNQYGVLNESLFKVTYNYEAEFPTKSYLVFNKLALSNQLRYVTQGLFFISRQTHFIADCESI